MEDQYSMADLRQYMNERSLFPPIPPPHEILSGHHHHRGLTTAQHYEAMTMVGRQGNDNNMVHQVLHQDFHSDHSITSAIIGGGGASSGGFSGLEMEAGGLLAGDGGTGRWPRQETLTLLEIRSKLDSKFKEANQKGPLWDEVSRMMSEEHGYQRSGKKCREKFENLYKYYKKTKEGKAGRQDGKHYRFFRQLEALYGESSSNTASASASASDHPHHLVATSFHYNAAAAPYNNNNNPEPFQTTSKQSDYSLSLSNSSDFDTTSSDDGSDDLNVAMENDSIGKRKKRSKRGWKAKIKDFIDGQMAKLMDKQEAWLDNMMKTIEHKEFERMLREEEWRKQEEARIEKEHKFWAKERSWIEARDTALMEALHKLTGKEFIIKPSLPSEDHVNNDNGDHRHGWDESEITRLIQLRTALEPRFETMGCSEIELWEDISAKMGSFGYAKNPLMCKEKWDSINEYLIKCKKKGKENSASFVYFHGNENICHQVGGYGDGNEQVLDSKLASNHHHQNISTAQNVNDSCFRYFMGDADQNFMG